jgi:2-iminoacetate synthase ThiH
MGIMGRIRSLKLSKALAILVLPLPLWLELCQSANPLLLQELHVAALEVAAVDLGLGVHQEALV